MGASLPTFLGGFPAARGRPGPPKSTISGRSKDHILKTPAKRRRRFRRPNFRRPPLFRVAGAAPGGRGVAKAHKKDTEVAAGPPIRSRGAPIEPGSSNPPMGPTECLNVSKLLCSDHAQEQTSMVVGSQHQLSCGALRQQKSWFKGQAPEYAQLSLNFGRWLGNRPGRGPP